MFCSKDGAMTPNRALQATVTSGLRPLAPGPERNRCASARCAASHALSSVVAVSPVASAGTVHSAREAR